MLSERMNNFINKEILEYVELFSQKEPDLLKELNRETNLKVLNPRMLSGAYQGRILSMISKFLLKKISDPITIKTAKKEKIIKFNIKLRFPFFNSLSFFTYLLKSP
jgi:hypothetical protein